MPRVASNNFTITTTDVPAPSGPDTALKTFVDGMSTNSIQLYTPFNAASGAQDVNLNLWAYCHSGVIYDPNRKKFWLRLQAQNASYNNQHVLIEYDESTQVATTRNSGSTTGVMPGGLTQNAGHTYGAFDVDLGTGRPIYAAFKTRTVFEFIDGRTTADGANYDPEWRLMTTAVYEPQFTGTVTWGSSLRYHPNLFGAGQKGYVLATSVTSSVYGIYFFNPADGTYTRVRPSGFSTGAAGTYSVSTYSPQRNAVYVTSGSNSNQMWKVSQGGNVTQMPNCPAGLTPGSHANGQSLGGGHVLTVSPTGAPVILERGLGSSVGTRIYRLNDGETAWDLLGDSHPVDGVMPTRSDSNQFKFWTLTYINGYNAYVAVTHSTNNTSPLWFVWKPPASLI